MAGPAGAPVAAQRQGSCRAVRLLPPPGRPPGRRSTAGDREQQAREQGLPDGGPGVGTAAISARRT
eukprot:5959485-Lingulodinium_polyedra.AAC.1